MSRQPRIGSRDSTDEEALTEIHAVSGDGAGYDTLCGLDLHDKETTGLYPVTASPSAKITCSTCQQTIIAARRYSISDLYFPLLED